MKIRKEHFEAMRAGISDFLVERPCLTRMYQDAGLAIGRFRWDALYGATIEGMPGCAWVCKTLYPYCNDDHIDTALRRIVPDFFAVNEEEVAR